MCVCVLYFVLFVLVFTCLFVSFVQICNMFTSQDGAAPLFCSVQEGHWEVVDLLLENGADVNSQLNKGPTPLYIAAQEGYKGLVTKLIKYKADPDRRAHVSNRIARAIHFPHPVTLTQKQFGIYK